MRLLAKERTNLNWSLFDKLELSKRKASSGLIKGESFLDESSESLSIIFL
jgi:hypothetical protein